MNTLTTILEKENPNGGGRTINSVQHRDMLDRSAALHNVLMTTDAAGNPLRYYIWGRGLVAQIETNGTVYYYHPDTRGSTLAMTDASGSTVAEYAYSPYGQIMNHTGVDTHYNWIGTYGVWQEGADMFQMKARYYNATLRRFVTPDPIGVNGGFNLYVYANSNPVFFLDPLGLLSVSLFDGNDDGRIRDVAGGTDFSAAAKRIDIFRYDMGDDADLSGAISYIERVKKLGFTIDNIYLWDHGGVDYGQEYNDSKLHELPNAKHDMKIIGELMTSDGVVHFMGCSVGGEGGHLQEYANSFNRKVTASSVPVYYGFCNNLLGVYRVFFYVESKMPEEKKWF